jgi:acyl-CoA synthetase (NDP forming)
MDELASVGVGVGKVVSYGNMSDVCEADCLDYLAIDADTSAVAIYMESVSDGRAFVEAAARCSAVKPVVALKVGRSAPGAAAAMSHTGAIAGRYEIYRAAFRKAGVIEVGNYEGFIGACKALGMKRSAAGGRVVIITDGGGMGVEMADLCSETGLGLTLPELDPDLALDLVAVFPEYYQVGNPMDLTWSVTDEVFAGALEKTLAGDYYDMAIVAAHLGPPALTERLAELVGGVAESTGKPVLVCSPGGESSRQRAALFREYGLPVFHTPGSAVRAASILAKTAREMEGAGC